MTNAYLEQFVNSYLATAKWSSDYDTYNFSAFAKQRAKQDCIDFIEKIKATFDKETADIILSREHADPLAPHDFWLTRNHHGAGFWDGDWLDVDPDDKLSIISEEFKELDVYIDNNEELHFS